MKIACALTFVGAAYAATTSFAAQVGTSLGKLNTGSCLAFQDNQNDETTTCYLSCQETAKQVSLAFDPSKYTGGNFNSGDMMTNLQNAGLQLMTQFQDCKTTEFLFSLDNRFSDTAFVSGSIANLGTQLATLLVYRQLGSSSGSRFKQLADNHSMNKVYLNLKSAVVTNPDKTKTI